MSDKRSEPWCKKDHKIVMKEKQKATKTFSIWIHIVVVEQLSHWRSNGRSKNGFQRKRTWRIRCSQCSHQHLKLNCEHCMSHGKASLMKMDWDGETKEKYVKSKPCQKLWFFVFVNALSFDGQFSFFFPLTLGWWCYSLCMSEMKCFTA